MLGRFPFLDRSRHKIAGFSLLSEIKDFWLGQGRSKLSRTRVWFSPSGCPGETQIRSNSFLNSRGLREVGDQIVLSNWRPLSHRSA